MGDNPPPVTAAGSQDSRLQDELGLPDGMNLNDIGGDISQQDMDEALNFDLDFDAIADAMGDALPSFEDDVGSIGNDSVSTAKRSRAEFDSESECSSMQSSRNKRMSFSNLLPLGGKDGVTGKMRKEREREGRCPDCGLDTHRIVMNDSGFEMQPLTIPGEVLDGRCLRHNPLRPGEPLPPQPSPPQDAPPKKKRSSKSKKSGTSSSSKLKSSSSGGSGVGRTVPPPPPRGKSGKGKGSGKSGKKSSKHSDPNRRHSAIQHARMMFGNTNNARPGRSRSSKSRSKGRSSASRRASTGSSRVRSEKDRTKSRSRTEMSRRHSSTGSVSSVSCSEAEEASVRSAGLSRMGQCNETASMAGRARGGGGVIVDVPLPKAGGDKGSNPHPYSNAGIGGPEGEVVGRSTTPQSAASGNGLGGGLGQPQTSWHSAASSAANLSAAGSVNDGRGPHEPIRIGSFHSQTQPSSNSMLVGNVPPAVRLAHSKLSSSIYHHHVRPMSDDVETAHMEKTLNYLESGSGDICDILAAMRRFPFSLAVQRVSVEKLYAHCFDTEHAQAIGLVGGIRTIIDAMEHHPDDVALQRGCAGVVKHLAGASSYNLGMLDKMGSVSIICATMERHDRVAPLLESCCWALESMTRGPSPELKMRIAKGGGIHAAMKAVENFPNNESLLRAAFHCLRQLGYNPNSYGNGVVAGMMSAMGGGGGTVGGGGMGGMANGMGGGGGGGSVFGNQSGGALPTSSFARRSGNTGMTPMGSSGDLGGMGGNGNGIGGMMGGGMMGGGMLNPDPMLSRMGSMGSSSVADGMGGGGIGMTGGGMNGSSHGMSGSDPDRGQFLGGLGGDFMGGGAGSQQGGQGRGRRNSSLL